MEDKVCSSGSSASRHTTSPRGSINEPICRSSKRNTLRTIACSLESITPALVPSCSTAWISSSVTAIPWMSFRPIRRNTLLVEPESSSTKGRVAVASQPIGVATMRAMASGRVWPMRLGTSSPSTMVT